MNHHEHQNTINGIKDLQIANGLELTRNLLPDEPKLEDQALDEDQPAITQVDRTILFDFTYISSLKHKKLLADQGKIAEISDV